MRQQIQNIAQNPEQERRVGEIISKTGINVRVKDAFDRIWIAEIGIDTQAGIGDTVVIRNDVVVSKIGVQEPSTIFEV